MGLFGRDTKLDREAVFEQLKIDEGVVNEIYHDHLGYLWARVAELAGDGPLRVNREAWHEATRARARRVRVLITPRGGVFSLHARAHALEHARVIVAVLCKEAVV